jgi:hypothetical protein
MHGDHQRRLHLLDRLDHVGLAERRGAVDRRQQYVDLAERRQVPGGERVMQMAQMGDAEVGDLENEKRPDRAVIGVGRLPQSWRNPIPALACARPRTLSITGARIAAPPRSVTWSGRRVWTSCYRHRGD